MKLIAFAFALASVLLTSASAEARPMRMCPMIYRPVCAIERFHHRKTFGNLCLAEAANAHVIHEGRCRYRHS